jgi:hypothetical protein
MTTSPAITIGLLTHNYGRYIREAIDSVLAQTRTDWELVICDDASTDDTPQIVAPYLSDPRISYVRHEKNLGQGGNWGFALEQGTAPVLAVLHADDSYLPETLATVLPLFEANRGLDLVYGNWWRQVEGKVERVLGKEEPPRVLSGHDAFQFQVDRNTWLASAMFLSRRVVREGGPPRTDLKMVVDFEFFLRTVLYARSVQAVPEPLMVYRVHQASTTAQSTANGVTNAERERIVDIVAEGVRPYPALRSSLVRFRRGMARPIFDDGVATLLAGDNVEGRSLIARGLRLDRSILRHPTTLIKWLSCATGTPGLALLRRLYAGRSQGPSSSPTLETEQTSKVILS